MKIPSHLYRQWLLGLFGLLAAGGTILAVSNDSYNTIALLQTEAHRLTLYDKATHTQSQPAPVWTLSDITGRPFESKDIQGKATVINFWATWCPPCLAELPELQELYEAYRERGLEVIGICMDDVEPERLRDFIKKRGLTYTFLLGDADITAQFGNFPAIPTTFLINRQGLITRRYIGKVPKERLENGILQILEAQ